MITNECLVRRSELGKGYMRKGETVDEACKRYMRNLVARRKYVGRQFPTKFKNAKEYFKEYQKLNPQAWCLDFTNLDLISL